MGHRRLAITGVNGLQPMRDCGRRFVTAINGEIWNHSPLRTQLAARHKMRQDSDCDVLPHLIERHLDSTKKPLPEAVAGAVADLDGEFAVAVMDGPRMVLARDHVGVKPLYWGRDAHRLAFASERKALWSVGMEAQPVPPDSVVVLTRDGTEVRHRRSLDKPVEPLASPKAAYAAYEEALHSAVRKRVEGHDKIGVVFSGGVDSTLIAAAVRRCGAEPICFVAGSDDSPDVKAAREVADAMDLELHVIRLDVDVVRRLLPRLLHAIEERNQLHVETAIPLFVVAREASRRGLRVLLTGQGADELFAGYAWYPRLLARDGPAALRKTLDEDRRRLAEEALEREDKVAMSHGVELRVPFLDPEVVAVARATPLAAMLEGADDLFGKRVHRELAEAWGVPHEFAWRKKDAAQHGSRTRTLLVRAAAQDVATAVPAGYDPMTSVGGPVGSSQRYGHRYMSDDGSWGLDAKLQWQLDHLALREGTVSPRDAQRLWAYLSRTGGVAVHAGPVVKE